MEIPDVWQLDPDSPDWLETIIIRLLTVGVPPTAISHAFNVEVFAVKELQDTILTQKYGTAEISEAMNFLMWQAYQEGREILQFAQPAIRMRFITNLLSRQSVILGKQSPESLDKMRNALSDLYANIGVPEPAAGSIYATSPFTPANRDSNDSEEGSES
jgi:hypothetical protein